MARATTIVARITPESTPADIAFALQYAAAVGVTEFTINKNPTLVKAAAKLGGYAKVPALSPEAVATYRAEAKAGFKKVLAKAAKVKKPAKAKAKK